MTHTAFRLRFPLPESLRAHARALALGLACACVPGAALARDFHPEWPHSKDLILDTSPQGAGIGADLLGFPILVRLDRTNFDFSQAKWRGEDIRFSDPATGRFHAYEIEAWDSAGGAAAVWVRLDTVFGNRADQRVRMHWGHPTAVDISNPRFVFPLPYAYLGVWHLTSRPDGQRPNSVEGGPSALPAGRSTAQTEGAIWRGDRLEGEGAHLDLGDGYGDFSKGLTFSAWIRPMAVVSDGVLLDLGDGAGSLIRIGRAGGSDGLRVRQREEGRDVRSLDVAGVLRIGEWQHLAVTLEGGRLGIYRDGQRIATEAGFAPLRQGLRTANLLGIAQGASGPAFGAAVDEVRLSARARSAAWIKLGYENQRPDRAWVRPAGGTGCVPSLGVRDFLSVQEGEEFILEAGAECAEERTWTQVSGPAFRLLDPSAPRIVLRAPRIAGDTGARFVFHAKFGGLWLTDTVEVRLRESVPEPVFELPAGLRWDGRSALEILPDIPGWEALTSPAAPPLRIAWTVDAGDGTVDTVVTSRSLRLAVAAGATRITVGLCLENGAGPVCAATEVQIEASAPVGVRSIGSLVTATRAQYDAVGRKAPSAPPGGRAGPRIPFVRP